MAVVGAGSSDHVGVRCLIINTGVVGGHGEEKMASEVTWTVYLILLALVSRRSIQLEIANTTYTHWELQTEVRMGKKNYNFDFIQGPFFRNEIGKSIGNMFVVCCHANANAIQSTRIYDFEIGMLKVSLFCCMYVKSMRPRKKNW